MGLRCKYEVSLSGDLPDEKKKKGNRGKTAFNFFTSLQISPPHEFSSPLRSALYGTSTMALYTRDSPPPTAIH